MTMLEGLKKIKTWEWILLFILLAVIFLFRFKYEHLGGEYFMRVNRITGGAKIYKCDIYCGKVVDHKKSVEK